MNVNLPHLNKGHCFRNDTSEGNYGEGLYCWQVWDRPHKPTWREMFVVSEDWNLCAWLCDCTSCPVQINSSQSFRQGEKERKSLDKENSVQMLKWRSHKVFPHGQFDFIVHEMATHCRWVVLLVMPKKWKNKRYILQLLHSVTHSWW